MVLEVQYLRSASAMRGVSSYCPKAKIRLHSFFMLITTRPCLIASTEGSASGAGAGQGELDAAVLRPPLRRVVGGDRVKPLREQAARLDAADSGAGGT